MNMYLQYSPLYKYIIYISRSKKEADNKDNNKYHTERARHDKNPAKKNYVNKQNLA